MAADLTVNTGNYGRWRGLIQLISQNQANNTSYIRVRGIVYNDGISTSYNNNGVDVSLTNGLSYSASPAMSVPGPGSQTLIDRYFTVTHDSAGYKTQTVNVNLGDTLTGNIGGPASVSLSLALPRIPKAPTAPLAPTASPQTNGTKVDVSWLDPSDWGGDDTSQFDVAIADNSGMASATVQAVTGNAYQFTGLTPGSNLWTRVRAKNADGPGEWSPTTPVTLRDYPSAPGTPSSSLITGTSFREDWTDPTDWGGDNTSQFDIEIGYNASFTAVAGYPTVTGNFKTFSGFAVGSTLYARVRALNSVGYGPWSGVRTIVLVGYPTAPSTPTMSLITGTTARASWSDPADWKGDDTSQFEVQTANDSGMTIGVVTTPVTGNLADLTGFSPGSAKYARVRAVNMAGGGTWSGVRAFTLVGYPSAPGTPAMSLITGTSARADWTDPADWKGDDTSQFDVQIANDSGMTTGVVTTPVTGNTYTFAALTPGSVKHTRVRGKNVAGNGTWSAVRSFTLLDYPSAPQNPTVTELRSSKATLSVSAPASNGGATITGYRFQVSTDPGFATTVYDVTAATLTRAITGLDPSTDHYWRAQAINSVGAGAWASAAFKTKSAALIQKGGAVKQVKEIYIQKAGVPKLVSQIGVKSGTWNY